MMKPWDCKRCKNEATCILAGDMQATASCSTFAPVPEMKCPHCGKEISDEEIARYFAALGGRSTSPRKAAAVRENGKKGGRPRAKTVGLENPWSQAGTPEPWTWAQIKQWALDHVHHSDRHNWLRVARRAFARRDGAKLGIMVLGS